MGILAEAAATLPISCFLANSINFFYSSVMASPVVINGTGPFHLNTVLRQLFSRVKGVGFHMLSCCAYTVDSAPQTADSALNSNR